MGMNRYGTTPTGRTTLFLNYLSFEDLALLEHGTQGHMIFNFGQYFNSSLDRRMKGVYNTSMGELDLVLGVDDKIYEACQEVKEDGYKNLLLLPSAIVDVMGIDLDFYAQDLSEKEGINVIHPSLKSDADFYEGEEAFFNSLLDLITEEPSAKEGISILGDLNTFVNSLKHHQISSLLKEYFGIDTIFDSCKQNKLEDVNKIINSRLNIVTSYSALKLAEDLKKHFDIPYYYLNSIDLDSIKLDLENISNILSIPLIKEFKDDYYDGIKFQFQNILRYTFEEEKEIVLYLNIDNITSIKKLFDSIDVKVTIYSTHKNKVYPSISYDEFIDKYLEEDKIIISNDLVSKYLKNVVVIEQSGLYYSLLTPNEIPNILLGGAYKLMKQTSDMLIKD